MASDRLYRARQHGRADGGQSGARPQHQVTGYDIVAGPVAALAATGRAAAGNAVEAADGRRHRDHDAAGRAAGARGLSRAGRDHRAARPRRALDRLLDDRCRDRPRGRRERRPRPGSRCSTRRSRAGSSAPRRRRLTFMVGGDGGGLCPRPSRCCDAMGRTIVHAGPSGNGQTAKICNNMILGVSMIGVCEAFALAEKLGLPAQTLFDICSKSTSQCWAMTGYCPVPGPVPASPLEPRLRPRLHRGHDAEGSAPGPAGGRRHRGGDPARRGGGQPLPALCRQRRRRSRFFRDHAVSAPRRTGK